MRQQSTETVDKAVCTEEGGAARLEAVLVALVERKARALHAEQVHRRTRTHPLLLLLRDAAPDDETSIVGSSGEALPSHWCEHENRHHRPRNITLQTHGDLSSPEQLELERRRRRRRRRRRSPHSHKPRKHRTLLVSAIDEQAKVIHVLDPDELPRRARYTIMVTACLLLFLCLLLVGVTLRMAPLIDDMGIASSNAECSDIYKPVCGSNGVTFKNKCFLKEMQEKIPTLVKIYNGPCNYFDEKSKKRKLSKKPLLSECVKTMRPVCGSDGTTYRNECFLDRQQLRDPSLEYVHKGECKKENDEKNKKSINIRQENERLMHDVLQVGILNRTQSSGASR